MPRNTRSKELPALYFYVGKRIREAREAADMTQGELAQKISLVRTSIVNFESGRQRIPLEDIYRFAQIFGISISDLLPELNAALLLTTEQAFMEFLKGKGANNG
jgi:transcriptional regulator with XRE-family HTH domain